MRGSERGCVIKDTGTRCRKNDASHEVHGCVWIGDYLCDICWTAEQMVIGRRMGKWPGVASHILLIRGVDLCPCCEEHRGRVTVVPPHIPWTQGQHV